MSMIPEWVPPSAVCYRISTDMHGYRTIFNFYDDDLTGTKNIKDKYKYVSELELDLAISDVCQQIREKKPETLDEAFAKNHMPTKMPDKNISLVIKSKYHREIKPGVWVDVYDVLNAFGVKCHALAHAIKKLLMPGERGSKGYKQDCEEAIQSVKRSIDEWG